MGPINFSPFWARNWIYWLWAMFYQIQNEAQWVYFRGKGLVYVIGSNGPISYEMCNLKKLQRGKRGNKLVKVLATWPFDLLKIAYYLSTAHGKRKWKWPINCSTAHDLELPTGKYGSPLVTSYNGKKAHGYYTCNSSQHPMIP